MEIYQEKDVRFCKFHYRVEKNGKQYCINAPIAITSYSTGFEDREECFYKSYEDPFAPDTFATLKYLSQCGYNNNGLFYCDMLGGNYEMHSILETMREAFSKRLSCQYTGVDFSKNITLPSTCKALNDAYPDLFSDSVAANIIIMEKQWHDVVANDFCVMKTLTSPYHYPYGIDLSSIISFSASVLAVSISILI